MRSAPNRPTPASANRTVAVAGKRTAPAAARMPTAAKPIAVRV
jgi:hypothetical protein